MPELHAFALILLLVAIMGAMRPRRFGHRDPDLVWRRASPLHVLRWRIITLRERVRSLQSQSPRSVRPWRAPAGHPVPQQ